jgi:hypothetical protein
MRRMQDDIDVRLDGIAEGFEIGRADDAAETLAAERIATSPRSVPMTRPRRWPPSGSEAAPGTARVGAG